MAERSAPRPAVACRVCGARRSVFLCRTINEHSRTGVLDNFRCLACGSVFIGNTISDEELAEAYASQDWEAYYRESAQASLTKLARAADDIATHAGASTAILDIGGGNGAFTRHLATRGFGNLSLHEIPGADLPDLRGIIRNVYRDVDYSSVPTAAFDVVTMMDAMEHVPDPDATVDAARRILSPGGIFYVHTPAVTPLDRCMHVLQKMPAAGAIGRAWQRARTSIFHLQNYSLRGLTQLVDRHGFDIVSLCCINELSWPVARYVRVYLVDKRRMPKALAPLATLMLTPIAGSSRLNANKAVLVARRRA